VKESIFSLQDDFGKRLDVGKDIYVNRLTEARGCCPEMQVMSELDSCLQFAEKSSVDGFARRPGAPPVLDAPIFNDVAVELHECGDELLRGLPLQLHTLPTKLCEASALHTHPMSFGELSSYQFAKLVSGVSHMPAHH